MEESEIKMDKNNDRKSAHKKIIRVGKLLFISQGTKTENIVSTTVYLKNHDELNTLDEFFKEFFGNKPPAKKIIRDQAEDNIPILIDAVAIVR